MRKLVFVMAVVVMLGAIVIPLAVKGQQGGQAGNSNIAQVELRPPPPEIFGTMHYNLSGCTLDFVFNAHSLEPGVEYRLEFFKKTGDPKIVILGYGTANGGGNVHIANSVDVGQTMTDRYVRLRQWDPTPRSVVLQSQDTYGYTWQCP